MDVFVINSINGDSSRSYMLVGAQHKWVG